MRQTLVTAAALALLLTGCTTSSSHSQAVQPVSAGPAVTTSGAVAAATATATTTTASATPSGPAAAATSAAVNSTAAPTTTTASTQKSRSASPTSKVTTAPATTQAPGAKGSTPINPADPAVKAMRAWFVQVAKAINAKKYETPAVDALMTSAFRTRLKVMFGREIGSYYPGPFPSMALSESTPQPGLRIIQTCDVLDGFATNPKTHKPAHSFVESAGEVHVQLQKGGWVMQDWIDAPDHHSCAGVKVVTQPW